ncbi:hypothetical protein QCH21_002136 [Enterobacter bugandensis]|uniref:DUF4282 domain-containing protein n=1 Tax=Enterobacter hormaechei TaxID=158836 RepID=UPI0024DEC06A|nr:DUF4282 domain-containing protein [Enterobacter hormaechei]EKS6888760.1 hypothetical protein [Enterobacter bugandensis]EKS7120207.1 hypothetical protein [Enterobacter bugandensis]MDK2357423.1 DUF4282 domain-containing protein [Enterobacter hormaechei]HEM8066948.1 hypothetical protein [Enterobacter hormaechei]
MKSILGFDYLLTPRVLVFFYWLVMLSILLGGIYSIFAGSLITGFFGMVFSLIGCRVMFELIMVAFKNNEYLRRIAENSEKTAIE